MFPNFSKSILNLSSSLSNFLGAKSNNSTLKVLDDELAKDYKNVVFIILDGLGIYNIKKLAPQNSILRSGVKAKLTSTMPATTPNATTTIIDCKYPSEHLWLGWCLWQEEQKKTVEIYLSRDYYTKEKAESYFEHAPYKTFYERANTDTKIFTCIPSYYIYGQSENNFTNDDVTQLFENLNTILNDQSKKFVYCYTGYPDTTMHDHGAESIEAKQQVELISKKLDELKNRFPSTLFIITADHGHITISEFVEIYKNQKLTNMLERPFSMEPRFCSFKLKPNMAKEFEREFKQYSKDFKLFRADYLIKKGIFGNKNSDKIKELIGDYVAIGNKTKKSLVFSEDTKRLKGNHAGYTKEEMQVPLIIFN